MRIGWMVMNPGQRLPETFSRMETVWRNPETPTFAAQADAVSKLYGSGLIPLARARADLGYSIAEREEMTLQDDTADAFAGVARTLLADE